MDAPERPTQTEPKPDDVNARRKLIRGAFALPAMAAVHSGSALAASSSLRCLGNSPAGNGENVPGVLDGTSPTQIVNYLRIPLAVTRRVNPNNSNQFQYRYYVAHSDLVLTAAAYGATFSTTDLVGSNRFKQFDVTTNAFPGSGNGQILNNIETGGYTLQVRSQMPPVNQKTAVLIFSIDGKQIVGVGRVTGPGNVATQSCWTSFVPRP